MSTYNANNAAQKTWVNNASNVSFFTTLHVRDAAGNFTMASESQILTEAARAVEYRHPVGTCFSRNEVAEEYFRAKLAGCEREVFAAAFLTNQNVLIEYRELFAGTINCVEVKPREIVKVAMSLNAAAVILSHNHPSYSPEPSKADVDITRKIKGVLDLLDVRILDHIIVAGNSCISMAARGLVKAAGISEYILLSPLWG